MHRFLRTRSSVMPWLVVGIALIAAGSSSPSGGLQACGFAFLGLGLAAMLRRRPGASV